jgi:hypothetical protein
MLWNFAYCRSLSTFLTGQVRGVTVFYIVVTVLLKCCYSVVRVLLQWPILSTFPTGWSVALILIL